MIELRQLRQFVAVAEEMSFHRAAERLHMAQPPLTAAIRKIEQELGVILLERGNRVTRITEAGQVFLIEARRTLAQFERTLGNTRRAALGLTESLRLTFVDSTVNALLPGILRQFRLAHPQAEFHLQEATTAEQLIALRDDRADLGMVVLPITPQEGLQILPFLYDRMVLALPENHPLAAQQQVTLSSLAEQPWVLFPAHYGPGMHTAILQACAVAGFSPRIVQEARQMQTIGGLVAGGVGIALMPALFARLQSPGVVFRELSGTGSPVPYTLALAWRTASPLTEAFCRIAAEQALNWQPAVIDNPHTGGIP
ncbi:Ben and cat operon transcriptional regulator [Serratia quinivorans]|uniref:LysR family transcriptional regulator n=1 Tax=Serratia TaxID=613 RepID=UPI002177F441|nr:MULTISPECIES: LysR family transcriptional regulator [Serratia]CAI0772613.1 Ben and cat operon transcriptional regulator [Serratia quinivorans]CAI0826057.1 Ben and cat operon transcriptional regulator [Serratia quinivorans]CAI0998302.1 Ben and cat operon transcriptional regulator [Serratia quinivorans]CAI1716770.1 Ben and cat operon transcriptional regulator [Serratia quinivorans]CAI1803362.1 Ben and cat operon transcriptional regulator [Serratia quinivorans]